MTPKQQKFCEFYAANGNGTQSAKLAGYSEKTARQISEENLKKPAITDYLAKLTKTDTNNRIMDAMERQTFLSDVVRSDEKIGDRIRACELLGRMQGDFIEKQSIPLASDHDLVRDAIIAKVLAGWNI